MSSLLDVFDTAFANGRKEDVMSFAEYLALAKKDPSVYASPARRMLKAIGSPKFIDTRPDPRLSQIFSNKVIKVYPAFSKFFGMEEAIEQIVAFYTAAANGLEESKQILYLLGPVGGGKSSIAARLRELIEQEPVYVIEGSPIFESPLSIFNSSDELLEKMTADYGIPKTAVRTIPSPWLLKRLEEVGSISKLKVRKIYPSALRQQCSARVEPGDENNQDVSSMTGKLNLRMIERFEQDHPMAYSFSGGLNRSNQGLLEMVEMFKAPIKMLHPLLTATQEYMYAGTEAIGSIPFDGLIIAHSNESEWSTFRNNKNNEAFLDRVCLVNIPYCLRVTEEQQIYEKLVSSSQISDASIAPGTLKMLAEFCVMSRLVIPENSTLYSKLRVYDGVNVKAEDPKAKPIQEYRDAAGVKEGMDGLSTRFAFKMLSKTLAFDNEEVAANPIHLMYVLKTQIPREQFPKDKEQSLIEMIDGVLQERYLEFLEKDITTAFLDSYSEMCQNMLEQYYYYADAWVQQKDDFRDTSTGAVLSRDDLDRELSKLEKPAGISNPKDFRNDIVNFIIRYQASNSSKLPAWNSYEKIRNVIEKRVIGNIDELLPVISFAPKRSEEDTKKHKDFLGRMRTRGYTERQTRILCEWFMRVRKNS